MQQSAKVLQMYYTEQILYSVAHCNCQIINVSQSHRETVLKTQNKQTLKLKKTILAM